VEEGARPGARPEPIGAYLSRQRVLRGIGLDELEQLTRIPRRSLERLESGRFDANPDGFVRGFVRTVAAALGLDPGETVNRMLAEPVPGRAGHGRSHGRWLGALALVALAASLGVALTWWAGSPAPGAAGQGTSSTVRVRRDPVRALAEAQGLAAQAPAPVAASPLPSEHGADRDAGADPARR
jgi:Helix-turn-helix domain